MMQKSQRRTAIRESTISTCCAVKHMCTAAGRCSALRCQPLADMMSLMA